MANNTTNKVNPVTVARLRRELALSVQQEEAAATLERAWRWAAHSDFLMRDLRAAQAGQPLPSLARARARRTRVVARSLAA